MTTTKPPNETQREMHTPEQAGNMVLNAVLGLTANLRISMPVDRKSEFDAVFRTNLSMLVKNSEMFAALCTAAIIRLTDQRKEVA